MAKKTLNVGVIGVGGIAGVHFPGWRDSPLADMYAFADLDGATLKRVGEAQGVKVLYEDPLDLIADPNVDIVDDIKKMIAARDKSGRLLMTAQHFRFSGGAKALKTEVDAGLLGDIYHARSWMLRRSGAPTRAGFIEKKHSGGGPCIDIGVHILDLTLWMMGNPKPVTVSGVTTDVLAHKPGAFSNWGGPIPKSFDVEEFAAAFVRFDSGATLVIEVSWLLNHNTPSEDMQMWLYGDKAGAHWPDTEVYSTSNKTKQHFNTKLQRDEGGAPHAKECMAFAEAVAKKLPSPVPAEQSLDVIAILDGLYRSAASGKEIALKY